MFVVLFWLGVSDVDLCVFEVEVGVELFVDFVEVW